MSISVQTGSILIHTSVKLVTKEKAAWYIAYMILIHTSVKLVTGKLPDEV